MLGKIGSICTTDQKHKDFGKINVHWYYYKNELDFEALKMKDKEIDSIAEGVEVFLTNHADKVWVQSINGKAQVLTLDEFDALDTAPVNTFYSRAEYDINKKCLKPPFEKWGNRACSCKMPTNPLQQYIGCDACDKWFHPDCEGVKADVENFICSECKS